MLFAGKIVFWEQIQIISLLPLLGMIFYFYKIGNSYLLKKIYNKKTGNKLIKFTGGLCLEIYLVQNFLITDKINNLFPLNIVIIFIFILISAYFLRCCSKLFYKFLNQKKLTTHLFLVFIKPYFL